MHESPLRGTLSKRAKGLVVAAFAGSLTVFGSTGAIAAARQHRLYGKRRVVDDHVDATGDSAVVFADANNQVWTHTQAGPISNCGALALVSSLSNVTVTSTVPGTTGTYTMGMYKTKIVAEVTGRSQSRRLPHFCDSMLRDVVGNRQVLGEPGLRHHRCPWRC